MVSIATIISVVITLAITLILPIVIYIVLGVKNKDKGVWIAWLLGAAGFFVMQIIIRLPLLNKVSLLPNFGSYVTENYVIYCLVLAFSAALFEVTGRYFVAKIMNKDMTAIKSFAAGLGHGSIEAILIVGATYVNNLLYIVLINSGAFDEVVDALASLNQTAAPLLAVKEALINTSPGIFLLAGYERILTVMLQIALSMTVCYFVKQKKAVIGVLICFVCHGAVDFGTSIVNGMATVYLGNVISQPLAYGIVYAFLTIVAALSIVVIRYFWKNWRL